jgi:hypothetical protein
MPVTGLPETIGIVAMILVAAGLVLRRFKAGGGE